MTPFIGQGDYDTRIKKSREFLTTGNKVKLSIKFQGRQIQKPEFGFQLVERFKNDLAEICAPEGTAKLIGKRLLITFTPVKNQKTNMEKPSLRHKIKKSVSSRFQVTKNGKVLRESSLTDTYVVKNPKNNYAVLKAKN